MCLCLMARGVLRCTNHHYQVPGGSGEVPEVQGKVCYSVHSAQAHQAHLVQAPLRTDAREARELGDQIFIRLFKRQQTSP